MHEETKKRRKPTLDHFSKFLKPLASLKTEKQGRLTSYVE